MCVSLCEVYLMKIQPINNVNYSNINAKKTKSKHKVSTNTTFRGYEEVLWNALKKDLKDRAEVANTVQEVYTSFIKERGTKKMPFFDTVHEWILTKPTYFIEELSKPIADINTKFRDLFFKSKNENISILQGDNEKEAYIINFGKHGFWNFMFDSEYARNDMRLVFSSKDGSLELGTTKKEEFYAEQIYKTGFWKKNIFDKYTDIRIAQKTGDASEPVIW